jgi:hypothetical protein
VLITEMFVVLILELPFLRMNIFQRTQNFATIMVTMLEMWMAVIKLAYVTLRNVEKYGIDNHACR